MRLLIIDDDLTLAETLQLYFRSKHQLEADIAGSLSQGQRLIERQVYDVTLLDLNLPDGNGMDFIKFIREAQPRNQIIVITANSSIEKAVQAIHLGAFDMVAKPFGELDFLHHAVQKANEHQQLKSRLVRAESDLGEKYNFANIIGKSAAMQKIFKLIRDVAYSDATILIQGESGTGKELIARALHFHSARQDRELIAFNCSALSESLVESELFGHVKGAFTHAFNDKRGLFEVANHSSLFLDEIGDLSLTIQAKLLRVLQEGEIMRVGSTEIKKVDVRIIAATHHNLVEMVQQQRFRADLFFRLNVINIELPPLRAHKEDIEMLAMHFVKKYNAKTEKKIQGLTQEVMEKFMSYDWPGNIRELENAIERAVVLEKGDLISIESLPNSLVSGSSGNGIHKSWSPSFSNTRNELLTYKEAKRRVVDSFNWSYLDSLLRLTEGNISKASFIAGIERSNFKKLILQNGIDIKIYKAKNGKAVQPAEADTDTIETNEDTAELG